MEKPRLRPYLKDRIFEISYSRGVVSRVTGFESLSRRHYDISAGCALASLRNIKAVVPVQHVAVGEQQVGCYD